MASSTLWWSLLLVVVCNGGGAFGRRILADDQQSGFDQNYVITWGGNHVSFLDQGREIQLSMDKSSGAGFSSKLVYGSGLFHLKIKLPNKDSAGVVTAFYLSSNSNNHDELDFEFLGNVEGMPISLQTNIFANGQGNREQRIVLWFDPTADFHDYKILWNPYHIVFYVDEIPIRVFNNLTSNGVEYPSQAMNIIVSLWNGESWATNGGRTKINWADAPFTAQFQGFDIDGCDQGGSGADSCASPGLWWNAGEYKELTPSQAAAYERVKNDYLTYDYCRDKARFPVLPPECSVKNT
ncbi:xyloglucan endotransglucosylase/hydrolase protein 2-like [Typha latifolia]|uniref:xyloglucan endotransglucosylase/hydrolase protein 2-like n=1 Tax=Typha latifolia TaxID=4733 RepID=UPI003C2D81D2